MPIFAVEDHRLGELGMPMVKSDADAGLYQPAMAAASEEKQFCGSCLERIPACVCSTCDAQGTENVAGASSMVVQPSKSVEGEAQQSSVTEQQHSKKKEAKERRRELWDKEKKNTVRGASNGCVAGLVRGKEASRKLVRDIHDFYAEKGREAMNEDRQNISEHCGLHQSRRSSTG